MLKILATNDDGWDAPGLAALKLLAAELGELWVVAPRDPHSYAGHRITTDTPLKLVETAAREFHLSGTPADCVRVALTALEPGIELVLAGINRGGNLGADLYISGTVAAAREAALLGWRAVAISQYIRKGVTLDWARSGEIARPILAELAQTPPSERTYWNVNLPHLESGGTARIAHCDPDNQPLDVRFRREEDEFHYCGSYPARPQTPGRDVELCFAGALTVSRLQL